MPLVRSEPSTVIGLEIEIEGLIMNDLFVLTCKCPLNTDDQSETTVILFADGDNLVNPLNANFTTVF